ncbi:site-2 protease family protein [Dehalococcoidia bacterium]|nr:site-2 protease family protein [Dehalococcoidia bacterium]
MLKAGIPLGSFHGISIRLHYSWFIVFALVTFALAANYFPIAYPHWSLTARVAVGLATSLLFFGSVLAHELAHSLVAQAAGIRVHSITLFILGGLAQIAQEPGRPNVEFRVALAGPATSLALGVLFGAISIAAAGISEPLVAASAWLGWINIVLAVFNLIPGFPLDGGRVLRSIIWRRTGNLRSATRIASAIGRGVGYLFIFGGIWMVFQGNWGGLWIAFIGWFIQNAAAGSYHQVVLQDMLQGHSVSEVMMRDCPAVPPELTLEELVDDYILGSGRRCFPVVEGNRALGLMTVHNVKQVPRDLWPTRTLGEAMTPLDRLKWVGPGEDLSSVLQLMSTEDVNQLPVVDEGNIVGMVARENLLAFIHTRAELGK